MHLCREILNWHQKLGNKWPQCRIQNKGQAIWKIWPTPLQHWQYTIKRSKIHTIEMQTHKNHTKNIIPKIKTNKANTHPNIYTKRTTNNTRPKQAAENGWELGQERDKRKEKRNEGKGIGTKSKAKSIMKKGSQHKRNKIIDKPQKLLYTKRCGKGKEITLWSLGRSKTLTPLVTLCL